MNFTQLDSNNDNDIVNLLNFYEAYEAFTKIIYSKELLFTLNLQPGTVIFIDNYRVLHGRTSFQVNFY